MAKIPQLKPGEGAVVDIEGDSVAVYNDQGKVKAASAVCTHRGCTVGWNETDKTFDCPCHGSRFNSDFSVKNGPAARPLPPLELGD